MEDDNVDATFSSEAPLSADESMTSNVMTHTLMTDQGKLNV